jgi:hypothetical protein
MGTGDDYREVVGQKALITINHHHHSSPLFITSSIRLPACGDATRGARAGLGGRRLGREGAHAADSSGLPRPIVHRRLRAEDAD